MNQPVYYVFVYKNGNVGFTSRFDVMRDAVDYRGAEVVHETTDYWEAKKVYWSKYK